MKPSQPNTARAKAEEDAKKLENDKLALAKYFGATEGSNPLISVEQDAYGRWQLVQRSAEGNTDNAFFVIDSNGRDFDVMSAAETVRYYKDLANKFGGLDKLRTTLKNKGFLKTQDYQSGDVAAFNNAIVEAAMSHSIEQSQRYTIEGQVAFEPFSSWLTKRSATGDGSQPDAQREITDRLNAFQDLDSFVMDMLGRKATSGEKAEYLTKLNAEQKKAIRKTTVSGGIQTTTGELLTSEDLFRVMADVIKPAVKGTDLETITTGGGLIATQVVDIKEYARDFGIELTTKDALSKVLSGFTIGGSLDKRSTADLKTSIREMSKSFYSNLAPQIDAGVTVKDIAKQFAAQKAKVLELNDEAIDMFDDDIQQAVRNDGKPGVMSMTEYQVKLRNDPRWAKTQNAREEASKYATDILKSFGLMG
jgi:hypothetical protein